MKNGQSGENGNIGYTRRRKTKQKQLKDPASNYFSTLIFHFNHIDIVSFCDFDVWFWNCSDGV